MNAAAGVGLRYTSFRATWAKGCRSALRHAADQQALRAAFAARARGACCPTHADGGENETSIETCCGARHSTWPARPLGHDPQSPSPPHLVALADLHPWEPRKFDP
jgi:hypothetical protein